MITELHRQVQCLACGDWTPRPDHGYCPTCGARRRRRLGVRGGRRRRQPVDRDRIAACGSLFSDRRYVGPRHLIK